MKRSSLIAVIAALLVPAGAGWAQTDSTKVNQFTLGLNFLTHGEACGGGLPRAAESTEDKSAFMMGRVRLNLGYDHPWLEARAVVQNSAIWGMKGNQSLGLYEGWAKIKTPVGLFVQLGRIALSYDDERIIGANDFAMAARSHDVLRLGYEGHGHKFHAILGYNQNGENAYKGTYYTGGAQDYKHMQTAWYHYDIPHFPLGVSLLFMNVGVQAGQENSQNDPARVEYQQMYGGYLKLHPKYVTLEGAYYRQSGQYVNEEKFSGPLNAWMAAGKLTVKPVSRLEVVLGYDYLSGDDYVPVIYGGMLGMPRHAVEKGFSPLYGSRTMFYGIMDYFYQSAYSNGFTPGLQNAFAGVSGSPFTENLTIGATYHYLAVATQLKGLDSTLGHSIELQASYRFNRFITLAMGYTQMIGTETMNRLKQGSASNQARWGWFSLVLSPSIFSTKW